MLLTLSVVALLAPPYAVTRFDVFIAKNPRISVDMAIRSNHDKQQGAAHLKLDRPEKMYYSVKWGPVDYAFSVVGSQIVEVEHKSRRYYEFDGPGRLVVPRSMLSALPENTFPHWMLSGGFRKVLPQGVALKDVGPATIGEQTGDKLMATFSAGSTPTSFTVVIAKDGRPLYSAMSEGDETSETYFRNYSLNRPIPGQAFLITAPAGYQAVGTHRSSPPLEPQTQPASLGDWVDTQSGRHLPLKAALNGKLTLVALLGDDCPSSKASLSALHRISAVPVVIATSSAGAKAYAASGHRVLVDRTGRGMAALKTPGTPAFYLIGPDGVVAGSWFGFATAETNAFVRDVEQAARKAR